MSKLEGMDSSERERLWPQLVQGFKDLSQRLKVRFRLLPSFLIFFCSVGLVSFLYVSKFVYEGD